MSTIEFETTNQGLDKLRVLYLLPPTWTPRRPGTSHHRNLTGPGALRIVKQAQPRRQEPELLHDASRVLRSLDIRDITRACLELLKDRLYYLPKRLCSHSGSMMSGCIGGLPHPTHVILLAFQKLCGISLWLPNAPPIVSAYPWSDTSQPPQPAYPSVATAALGSCRNRDSIPTPILPIGIVVEKETSDYRTAAPLWAIKKQPIF
jgi:hypothetical protein